MAADEILARVQQWRDLYFAQWELRVNENLLKMVADGVSKDELLVYLSWERAALERAPDDLTPRLVAWVQAMAAP